MVEAPFGSPGGQAKPAEHPHRLPSRVPNHPAPRPPSGGPPKTGWGGFGTLLPRPTWGVNGVEVGKEYDVEVARGAGLELLEWGLGKRLWRSRKRRMIDIRGNRRGEVL